MAGTVTTQRAPGVVAESGSLQARIQRRGWPLVAAALSLAIGMAFGLFWEPVVRHHSYWLTPGDLWATYRSAHFIGWGYLGGVYSAGTGVVTFPGILLLLAPLAMLTGALGLTEAFPRFVPHPTAWLMLGPADILLSSVALFATDALAEHLGVGRARRAILCLVEAAILWNVSVVWGHPEDAVAIGLSLYALLFALKGRWSGAGWLFGAAMATQPLVVLMLPVLLALAGRRRAIGMIVRSFLPPMLLLATPLIAQFQPTMRAIFDQPNYPNIDHATPWTALAPKLGGTGQDLAVAGGPGRIVALLLACVLGFWARRWREKPQIIVWVAALAMALRCFSESVMDPYYLWPALAIALVAAALAEHPWRTVAASLLALVLTFVSDWRFGELLWWAAVTGGLVLVLFLTVPRWVTRVSRSVPDLPMTDDDAMSAFLNETGSAQLAGVAPATG